MGDLVFIGDVQKERTPRPQRLRRRGEHALELAFREDVRDDGEHAQREVDRSDRARLFHACVPELDPGHFVGGEPVESTAQRVHHRRRSLHGHDAPSAPREGQGHAAGSRPDVQDEGVPRSEPGDLGHRARRHVRVELAEAELHHRLVMLGPRVMGVGCAGVR